LVWQSSKTNNLSCKDVKGSSENLEPVIVVGLSNQIKIFLPVNEFALTHSGLSESKNCSCKVFGDSWMEVKLAPQLVGAHSNNVFVPNFFLL